ncbi:MAG: DUF2974 domain-containing protein [Erysipelotrichaceae bacterium]|nr:DUF2974 domain-containing protein [Erysipelotrichaceae bacterium]
MNFYDYLTWRGDLTFDRDQFNIVDNLLFAYSAYTDLREVITTDEPITVHEAAERFFKLHTEEECLKSGSLIAHAPVVLRRMGESRRFGDLLITDYVREIDEETSTQFSAMHFVINNRISYVAFCGTDDTIIGWKEDFQLSYRKVNAQLKAAEYLNRTADKSFHKYFIGGHSKGGNLAVYGAMEARDSVKKKIIRIYSNDGPGISSIAMNEKEFKKIGNRMIKVLPELSVFGMLFDNHEPKIVVKSDKSFLYEHDAVGWMVSGTDFVRGTLSPDCLVIQDVLNEFLEAMSIEERAELVDQMYSAFVNAGIENTTDFNQKGLSAVIKFLKEVTHLNENAGKSMEKLLQILGKMLTERAEGAVKSTVKNVTDALPDFLKQPLNRSSKTEEEKVEKE